MLSFEHLLEARRSARQERVSNVCAERGFKHSLSSPRVNSVT
jgi:hypothetical protein